jgi:hypothetical protein
MQIIKFLKKQSRLRHLILNGMEPSHSTFDEYIRLMEKSKSLLSFEYNRENHSP